MGKINLQEPYQLSKIIEIISKEIKEGGFLNLPANGKLRVKFGLADLIQQARLRQRAR